MKKLLTLIIAGAAFVACKSEPSLQKYFVDHADKSNFATIDIAPNLINTANVKATPEEQQAMKSLKKLNVLMYKEQPQNKKEYEAEKANVKSLLKSGPYEELMHFGSADKGASVSMLGEGEDIDEFVVYFHEDKTGFGVVRVLGEDMTPNDVLALVGLIRKGGLDAEQLKPLQQMMQKK